MATLKRETIISSTQTIFQTKLSEVLYEDSTCVSKGRPLIDEFKDVIDGLRQSENDILHQVKSPNLRSSHLKFRLPSAIKKNFSKHDGVYSKQEMSNLFLFFVT